MRNILRLFVFDVLAPAGVVGALVFIGLVTGWPLWWVAIASMLCLLAVQAVAINFMLMRRDRVTVGTDDDSPGLRLAVAGVATAALVAAAAVGYTGWTLPDRTFDVDRAEVVRIAGTVAEATATFSPQQPTAALDRAAAFMPPDRADVYRDQFSGVARELTAKNVTATASAVATGVEALGPEAASVAVMMRSVQSVPGRPADDAVLALRVTLAKAGGRWLVQDVTPLHSR